MFKLYYKIVCPIPQLKCIYVSLHVIWFKEHTGYAMFSALVKYDIIQMCKRLYCIILYCIVLYYIAVYCIVLFCIALFCILLFKYPICFASIIKSRCFVPWLLNNMIPINAHFYAMNTHWLHVFSYIYKLWYFISIYL